MQKIRVQLSESITAIMHPIESLGKTFATAHSQIRAHELRSDAAVSCAMHRDVPIRNDANDSRRLRHDRCKCSYLYALSGICSSLRCLLRLQNATVENKRDDSDTVICCILLAQIPVSALACTCNTHVRNSRSVGDLSAGTCRQCHETQFSAMMHAATHTSDTFCNACTRSGLKMYSCWDLELSFVYWQFCPCAGRTSDKESDKIAFNLLYLHINRVVEQLESGKRFGAASVG